MLDAMSVASAQLQRAARFAADLEQPRTKQWLLDTVTEIETEAQMSRKLLL
jgi:hypothetical protein